MNIFICQLPTKVQEVIETELRRTVYPYNPDWMNGRICDVEDYLNPSTKELIRVICALL